MYAPPPAVPHARVRPVWSVLGPALAALTGAFLLTMTLAPGWVTWARLDFHLSAGMTVVAAGGALVAALVTAPAGVFLGARHPFAVTIPGLALMIVGLPLDGLAPVSALLVVGRIVTGLGTGAVIATAVALSLHTGPHRRPAAATVIALVAVFALIGFALGGATGRATFMVAVLPLILALAITAVSAIVLLVQANHPGSPRR